MTSPAFSVELLFLSDIQNDMGRFAELNGHSIAHFGLSHRIPTRQVFQIKWLKCANNPGSTTTASMIKNHKKKLHKRIYVLYYR
jgi:hypothetical protein